MHSHFIPAIDDGSASIVESVEMMQGLTQLGYKKFITTPHIQPELFPNTEASILKNAENFQNEMHARKLIFEMQTAAEYYIDENFLSTLPNRKLLTFGNNFVLIEVSMVSRFKDLEKVIFELMLKGYKVILAHVERYPYMFENNKLDYYQALKDKEVYLQVNLRSFTGNYGDIQKKIARQLADNRMIDFLGSDLHKPFQVKIIEDAMHDTHVQKLLKANNLLNKTL
jgi:tyrosine-protein phosphatase YwqE